MILSEVKIPFLLQGSYVRCFNGSNVSISKNVRMKHVSIYVYAGASLVIGDNCKLSNVDICVEKGSVSIGHHSIVTGSSGSRVCLSVNDGKVHVGHHAKLSCRKIWVRFGGNVFVGDYTNINQGTEIRCDEKVTIGDYNQISYDVRIWDTNTHCILPKEERRKVTKEAYPYFGLETDRPKTQPVKIGSDCWIGERSALLKGTCLGNSVILGFNTVLTGQCIPDNNIVVTQLQQKILPNHV